MKILIVCSGNANNYNIKTHHTFIHEQIESIKIKYQIEYDTFFVKGKGIFGYLKNISKIKKIIKKYNPDLIHAHYGLSGLVSCFHRLVPVVITFHGSDANIFWVRILSTIASHLSSYNIFVSNKIKNKINKKKRSDVIPCGIDMDVFRPLDKLTSRLNLGMSKDNKYILFASRFENKVKNYNLAKKGHKQSGITSEIIELKNRNRREVNLLLNAVDLLLLTSSSEGSPQIIKEAMACNCPIVTTDVGDIKDIIRETEGCYISSFEPYDVAEKIKLAIEYSKLKDRTNGRDNINRFDNMLISEEVYKIYKKVINYDSNN